ncbi:MAG: SDR family oxidoreductase [Gammaproteobacteria bacterium]|jgi:NAD(P)-dependent dehydrogenase (short-subunit alcohol dehydrogenase family)|nr:SDR family oxidoreductase [Gammaproteobacteria bacterium]MBT3724503.1 SDR family oxidoreductase [Gammaproteobacteria bacterium]MBT4194454.1 SDR family oxidoreductase [Gammaproteobacteria bacterium]MBT4451136.1 SDR family oxidoreductase [Gammaproteobacteria bacterium]MBT4863301.1 SDR family oxidoreductase [Gammaproteobacteria bacterium]
MSNPQKIVVITGGAAGIGLAMAETFLAENALVAICDADPEAVAKFHQLHPEAIAQIADVTLENEMNQFLGEVERQWGYADVVCANAGTGGPAGLIEDLDYQQWQHCIATNVHGSFLTCRWAARVMRKRGKGLIILTSSTAGIMGYPFRSPYAAAKWAIVGICKTLAMELGSAGIRVNAICPGAVEGDRMDRVLANEAKARGISEDEVRASYVTGVSMKTWVSAQDIAASALFLASDAGAKISGQILSVDGNTETLAL